MEEAPEVGEAAAFPIRTNLRVAVAASVILAVVGGIAFLGLLRMSALKVHKSVALFGEPHPWPDTESPAALAIRTLESGRLSVPVATPTLQLRGQRLTPDGSSPQNLIYRLPASSAEAEGLVAVDDPALESPPLAFRISPRTSAAERAPAEDLDGLGQLIRNAASSEDQVAVPTVSRVDKPCSDIVTVIPAGGIAERFLPTKLLVRVTDAMATPRVSLPVELLSSRLGATPTPLSTTVTDLAGLGVWDAVLDAEMAYSLRWTCGGQPVSASVVVPLLADGMTVQWGAEPYGTERAIRLDVADLRQRATWQADLFCAGVWTRSTIFEPSSSASQFEVPPPPASATAERCLFQASSQPYLPHPQQAALWVIPALDPAVLRERALRLHDDMLRSASGGLSRQLGPATRGLLETGDEQTVRQTVRWLLSWLPRSFMQRPLLADSSDRDLAALQAYKDLWRTRFQVTLGVAVLGLLLIWLPRAIIGLLADRQALAQVTSANDGADGDSAPPTRLWRSIGGLILVALLAVVVVAAMVWIVS